MNKTAIALATAALVAGLACAGTPKEDAKTPNAGPQQISSDSPTTPPTSAPPAGPITAFADGTYEVGTTAGKVPAGKYKTTVPPDASICYWARLKGLSGAVADVIASSLAKAGEPVIVTIAATDLAFNTSGCGTWAKA